MRRHAHDGPFAVRHEHIVAHPELDLFACERMGNVEAHWKTLFLDRGQISLHDAAAFARLDEGCNLGVALSGVARQRMLGGDGTESHPHNGVRTCGEHL